MSFVMTAKQSLRLLRIDAGYDTQPELAVAAHVSVSTVWKAESRKEVKEKMARKIVNTLNIRLRERGFPTVTENDIDWIVT